MKNGIAALICGLLLAPALAADTYRFDPNHTRPMFEVRHMDFSTQHGRFDRAAGTVTVDAAARRGSIDFSVDTASIDMGTDEWNRHMKSDEFFDVAKYPVMAFKSDKLDFDGDRVVGADGQFTLRGVTRPLHIAVEHFRCGPNPMNKVATCGGDVVARIKRSEFGMTKFLPMVGDEVAIRVPFEAAKQ
ncbi:MAG TPA: YceI family protein [Rhodocyclaceae bacterium]